MINITRLNLRWLEFINESLRGKTLCIVGYSGRDLDLFPQIRRMPLEKSLLWINCFSKDKHSDRLSQESLTERLDGAYPDQVFDHLSCKYSASSPPSRISVNLMLDALEDELKRLLNFQLPQRQLMQCLLLNSVFDHRAAEAALHSVHIGSGKIFTTKQFIEWKVAKLRNDHERGRFRDSVHCASAGLLRLMRGDSAISPKDARSLRLELFSHRSQSVGINAIAESYFEGDHIWQVLLSYRYFCWALFWAILVELHHSLLRREVTDRAMQEVLESRIRILGGLQRIVLPMVARVIPLSRSNIERYLRRGYRSIFCESKIIGYAAGLANSAKFESRLLGDTATPSAQHKSVVTLIGDITGLELSVRNEANASLTRGDFSSAERKFQEFRRISQASGNVLNNVKALLGLAFTRKSSGAKGAWLDGAQIDELSALARQMQSNPWTLYLDRVMTTLRAQAAKSPHK